MQRMANAFVRSDEESFCWRTGWPEELIEPWPDYLIAGRLDYLIGRPLSVTVSVIVSRLLTIK